jgi:hypothetical protein
MHMTSIIQVKIAIANLMKSLVWNETASGLSADRTSPRGFSEAKGMRISS